MQIKRPGRIPMNDETWNKLNFGRQLDVFISSLLPSKVTAFFVAAFLAGIPTLIVGSIGALAYLDIEVLWGFGARLTFGICLVVFLLLILLDD